MDDNIEAGKPQPLLKVIEVSPLDGYKLKVQFSTGELKIFDFTPLLGAPAFQPLQDEALFKSVYLDHGIASWAGGEIDIAPEKLYADGCPVPAGGLMEPGEQG